MKGSSIEVLPASNRPPLAELSTSDQLAPAPAVGECLGDYFPRPALVTAIQQPFTATETLGAYDVQANLTGGGQTGQAGALRLAIARALVKIDEDLRPKLRDLGLLTRDARAVERKKPGRPKARKRFQFSKR